MIEHEFSKSCGAGGGGCTDSHLNHSVCRAREVTKDRHDGWQAVYHLLLLSMEVCW